MAQVNDSLLHWQLRSPTSKLTTEAASDVQTPLIPEVIAAGAGQFGVQWKKLSGGRSGNMECLTINTGAITASILPDRGMSLWKCWAGDLEFGWQSPVQGPVHPSFVPVNDASGIGWLEGFDELLVRCGLQSNGAPEFHDNGTLRYPLHGRIANLPAYQLDVHVDSEKGVLEVVGTILEARFLIYSLELQTRYRFRVGSPLIEVIDTVTNRSSLRGSMQMLYHINVGQPVLQAGSSVHAAYRNLTPRDARAQEGIDRWNHCDGPASGYQEQVYFIEPYADDHHWSEAMLSTADQSFGFAVHFDTRTLPYLNLWKNTTAVEDGYVLGLEPATGFPNPRSVEEKSGRVVALQGGESRTFRLKLQPLLSSNDVTQSRSRIERLQQSRGTIRAEV